MSIGKNYKLRFMWLSSQDSKSTGWSGCVCVST